MPGGNFRPAGLVAKRFFRKTRKNMANRMKNSIYPMPDKAWPINNSGNPQPDSIQRVTKKARWQTDKVRRMKFSTARQAEIIHPMTGGIHQQVGGVARQPKIIKRRRDGKGSGTIARLRCTTP